MVARRNDVDRLVLEDIEGVLSLWITRIVQAIALYPVACIYQQYIGAIVVCSLAKMVGEVDVVAPIGAVLRFLKMSTVPSESWYQPPCGSLRDDL